MKRAQKETMVEGLAKVFNEHDSFYLLDFKNMTVNQSVELRRILRQNGHSYKVVKNRLALRAMTERFPDAFREFFQDLTAIAFTSQDPINLARIIKDFSTQQKVLSVKGGMIEGQVFASKRFEEIYSLSSREELLGKIGYLMSFPLTRLLRTWQAPLSSLGRLLSQLKSNQ